ncbi:MAG: methyltransferase domain-containing protein [Myxococcota bacterium]
MGTSEGGARGWDQHAETYGRVVSPCTGYIAQNLFISVAGRLAPGARILDIACGHGELAGAALVHVLTESPGAEPEPRVCAIDASPEMVAHTTRNLSVLGSTDLVRCEVQDGQALSFPSSSFDAAFSAFGIFLFPDRQAGWREAARVLAPGGCFATAVWRGPEHNELARVQMELLFGALPQRVRDSMPQPGGADITTSEGLTAEVQDAGFVDAEVTAFDAVLTAPTPRAMWAMIRENPLAGAALVACTDDELRAVERAVVARFEELAGGTDRPVRLGASCHFLVARRG